MLLLCLCFAAPHVKSGQHSLGRVVTAVRKTKSRKDKFGCRTCAPPDTNVEQATADHYSSFAEPFPKAVLVLAVTCWDTHARLKAAQSTIVDLLSTIL